MRVGLPPGHFETFSEWNCDCPAPHCPNPVGHFYWNVVENVGFCQVCHFGGGGRKWFFNAFGMELGEARSYYKGIPKDTLLSHPELWTESAWDHIPSRNFLICRGLNEATIRQLPIWWLPSERVMAIATDKLSPELPLMFLFRYGETGKWQPILTGYKLSRYAFGVERWLATGSRHLILMEGFFDVVSPGLLGYAIAGFGTTLSKTMCSWMRELIRSGRLETVAVMYDVEDEHGQGQIAQQEMVKRLNSWGIFAYGEVATKDPKNLVPASREDAGYLDGLKNWVHSGMRHQYAVA